MNNALVRKLSAMVPLGDDDRKALDTLTAQVTHMDAGSDIKAAERQTSNLFVLLSGWAYRSKILSDGSRQVTAFLMPGDLCNPHAFVLREMDCSVSLLSDAVVAVIARERMLDVIARAPAVAQALWCSSLADEAIVRDWLVNVGCRESYSRVAHLLCELSYRAESVGLLVDDRCEIPVTQAQLADAVSLTAVHTNRVLRKLRAEGYIEIDRGRLTILDRDGLRWITDFDPHYLHLRARADEEEAAAAVPVAPAPIGVERPPEVAR